MSAQRSATRNRIAARIQVPTHLRSRDHGLMGYRGITIILAPGGQVMWLGAPQ
jgi:hypothetical protein